MAKKYKMKYGQGGFVVRTLYQPAARGKDGTGGEEIEWGQIDMGRFREARELNEKAHRNRKMITPRIPKWQDEYMLQFISRARNGPRKVSTTKTKIVIEALNLFYAANRLPPLKGE